MFGAYLKAAFQTVKNNRRERNGYFFMQYLPIQRYSDLIILAAPQAEAKVAALNGVSLEQAALTLEKPRYVQAIFDDDSHITIYAPQLYVRCSFNVALSTLQLEEIAGIPPDFQLPAAQIFRLQLRNVQFVSSASSANYEKIVSENQMLALKQWQSLAEQARNVRGASHQFQEYSHTLVELSAAITLWDRFEKDAARIKISYTEWVLADVADVAARNCIDIVSAAAENYLLAEDRVRFTGTEVAGEVVFVADSAARIRLSKGARADISVIPATGSIEKISPFQAWRYTEAVQRMRERAAENPYLVEALLGKNFQPPALAVQNFIAPATLNQTQAAAIQNAIAAKDVYLIKGPPGTGKTKTVSELAVYYAQNGARVLLTAHSNKAADTALKSVPDVCLRIRAGKEERFSDEMIRFTAEAQAEEQRKNAVKNCEIRLQQLQEYARNPKLLHKFEQELAAELHLCEKNERAIARLRQEKDKQINRIRAPYHKPLPANRAAYAKSLDDYDAAQKQIHLLEARLAELRQRKVSFWNKLAHNWRMRQTEQHLRRALQNLQQISDRSNAIQQKYVTMSNELAAKLQSPPIAALDNRIRETEDLRRQIVKRIEGIFAAGGAYCNFPETVPQTSAIRASARLLNHAHSAELRARQAAVLQDWSTALQNSESWLPNTITRSARIVATTTIGSAIALPPEEQYFDVAIVDEAGQCSLIDALIPMARARKTILAGDDMQLPPAEKFDFQQWFDTKSGAGQSRAAESSAFVRNIRAKSVFAELFTATPNAHKTLLNIQYRMSPEIADLVSKLFYHSEILTDDSAQQRAAENSVPLFDRRIVFIDTADLANRREKQHIKHKGFINIREAEILADLFGKILIEHPQISAGVIVPYREQARYIRNLLLQKFGAEQKTVIWESISTVDAFQGSERDIILFGFTRSSEQRSVGFLAEQTRLNVALSRAKCQLILVGDTSTLQNAKDDAFAGAMREIADHIYTHGTLINAAEFFSAAQ